VLQCVAVCCSVLQCVAVCCSVLQCVAVCCSVLQCVAVCCMYNTDFRNDGTSKPQQSERGIFKINQRYFLQSLRISGKAICAKET